MHRDTVGRDDGIIPFIDGDLLDATAYDDGGLIPSQSMAEGAGAAQGGGGMGE